VLFESNAESVKFKLHPYAGKTSLFNPAGVCVSKLIILLIINVSTVTQPRPIIIRDIELISEMRDVESLQKEIWGCDDRDIVPLTILAATREIGGILVGAFDRSSLIGFAYSLVGRENQHLVHHSHMLAVRPTYRNLNLGYKLKLAQRDRALAQGITRMTWTFDPLQSLNAHFNFAKLGVIADAYKINFYGETTSSFLHQIGTDRLWVTWPLDSNRVRDRLQTKDQSRTSNLDPDHITCLVQVGPNNVPQRGQSSAVAGQNDVSIEIPADINALQRESPELAVRWREATRWAFREAISFGYQIEDFWGSSRNDQSVGVYLLSYGTRVKNSV
jgi:predicted GNAT superfamily acetyltransferase